MPDLIVHTAAGPRSGLRLTLPAGDAVAIQLDGPPHVPAGSTTITIFEYVHATRRLDPLDTLTPGPLLGYFTGAALWLLDDAALEQVQDRMAAAETQPDREREGAGVLASQMYASTIFQRWVAAHSVTPSHGTEYGEQRRQGDPYCLRTGTVKSE